MVNERFSKYLLWIVWGFLGNNTGFFGGIPLKSVFYCPFCKYFKIL